MIGSELRKPLLILEDDPFREREFRRFLARHGLEATILADPVQFLTEATLNRNRSPGFGLLSIDHDLSRLERPCGIASFDCGCAVVEFLIRIQPLCPVLVHSQNDSAREMMTGRLLTAGWEAVPITDDPSRAGTWIENTWLPEVLGRSDQHGRKKV